MVKSNTHTKKAREPKSLLISTVAEAGLNDTDLCSFYSRYWERPIALAREDFVNWQFSMSPHARGKNNTVVALLGDEIIAAMGAVPRPFYSDGKFSEAAELTTWVVAPEARGRGVGTKILKFLQGRYQFLSGAGITAQALPVYLKCEFTFLAHIPRFFFISRFDLIDAFAQPSTSAVALVKNRQKMGKNINVYAHPCSASSICKQLEENACAQGMRNSDYLKWRYDQHPVFNYEGYEVVDTTRNKLKTGVIVRQDNVDGVPFLHLIDIVGCPSTYSLAVAFLEAEAMRRGCAFVDASCTSNKLVLAFRARGWNSVIDDPFIEMPSLFHPVEFRRPPTTSLVFWSKANKDKTYEFGSLHFTKGDLDLDRPTLNFYHQQHGEIDASS